MPYNALKMHYDILEEVTTMAQVQRDYCKHPKSVRYAIDAGNIAAKQVGGVWLISVASVRRWWGEPPNRHNTKTR